MTPSSSASKPLITHIYTLHEPLTGELRYVGKTVLAPERRLGTHMTNARRAKGRANHTVHWLLSLDKLGLLPELRLLQTIVGDQWVEAERYWIGYFRDQGCRLTNLADGGAGVPGHHWTDETRRKVREWRETTDYVASDATRQRMATAARERGTDHMHTPEARAKRAIALSTYAHDRPRQHTLAIAKGQTKTVAQSRHSPTRVTDPQRPEAWRAKIGDANRGAKNGAAKLSEADVSAIKSLLMDESHTRGEIATMYGVSPALIRLIRLGDRWAHVPWPQ